MKIDFDNPKWTAYVLGELSPKERAAVELELAGSAELQAFVNELQMAATTMKERLHEETGALAGLSFVQRKTVREAAAPGPRSSGWRAWLEPSPLWTGVHAGLIVAAVLIVSVVLFWPKSTEQRFAVDGGAGNVPSISDQHPQVTTEPHPEPPPPSDVKTPPTEAAPKEAAINEQTQKLESAEGQRMARAANNERESAPPQEASNRPAAVAVTDVPMQLAENTPPVAPVAPRVLPPPPTAVRTTRPSIPLPARAAEGLSPVPAPAQQAPEPRFVQGLSFAPIQVVPPVVPNLPTSAGRGNGAGVGVNDFVAGAGQAQFSSSLNNGNNRGGGAGGAQGGGQRGQQAANAQTAASGTGIGQGGGFGPGAAGGGRGGGGGGGGGNGNGAGAGFGLAGGLANSTLQNRDLKSNQNGVGGGGGTDTRSRASAVTIDGANFNPGDSASLLRQQLSSVEALQAPVGADANAAANLALAKALAASAAATLAVPVDVYGRRVDRPTNEAYDDIADNPFYRVGKEKATLSIDVDTAGYSNVRRFLNQGQLPPRAAVRIEELVNYFRYDYPFGKSDHPITANIEAAAAPWNPEHRLVRIGIKAKDAQIGEKPSNLVFLIDVSGSMEPADRLPLLKQGLRMLVERLTENDRVTIVTYAGESGVALPPTNGSRKDVIVNAIDGLRAEGSTNGGAGIQTAYDMAAANFIKGGVNRVVLMTDGDFNVGITSQAELDRLIEEKAKTGVFLSVLGVGTGNLKDSRMERLADRGNGLYAYIDSLNEAKRVLVDQMGGTLIAVAKDVKIQVEFNPAQVAAYRLIGYENRVMAAADFANDKKDAGDMGAGHTVTALFEVVPIGAAVNTAASAGPLRYQAPAPAPAATPTPAVDAAVAKEMLNLSIRYKEPEASDSKQIDFPIVDRGQTFANASVEFRFAAAVAEFGMILRESPYRGAASWESVTSIANGSRGSDKDGYREEFVRLAQRAEQLSRQYGR